MPNTYVYRPPFRKRGQSPFFLSSLFVGSATGSGGVVVGGSADVTYFGGPQVDADVVVEWDLDNDGDFSESVEDITDYVLALEVMTGRDWPSLLTGKAGPGKFRATLRNDDDRFNYFNTGSPLATSPFSLKTGRKLRVRTSTASNPDPVLLAKDRFGRADGALGTPETGAAWSGPLANDFAVASMKAKPATEGQTHIGVIDVGATAYYAQARLAEVGGRSNVVGLVYRYQDTDDYSLAVLDVAAAQLKLIDVVSGTPSTVASESVEVYDEITLGVLVSGTDVTLYHEGVPVLTGTAVQTDETEVGIYAAWGTGDVRPEVDDFYVWDGLPSLEEGVLWTGDVSDLTVSVAPGPEKFATLEGEGWLSRLAGQELTPMRSAVGKKTGILVGNVLARTNLLHPPGWIDEGDITTGPVALDDMDGIEAAREFEETEFGFLYESQEGPLSYDSRTARAAAVSQATFSDGGLGQYSYSTIEPLDWRREVINRVLAGVAPAVPTFESLTAATQTNLGLGTPLDITMPATVAAGDLLLVAVAVAPDGDILQWETPAGWVPLYLPNDYAPWGDTTGDAVLTYPALWAKLADGTEDGVTLTFGVMTDTSANGGVASHVYRISDWFGSIESGIELGDFTVGSDPAVVFPSWGPNASLFVAFRFGTGYNSSAGSVASTTYPLGYVNGTSSFAQPSGDADAAVQSAYRLGVVEVENPSTFGGTFSGFRYIQSVVVAVRGYNGDPPEDRGVVRVQLDDLDSQDDHNSIRTHTQPSNLFASSGDATTYAQLVLDTYADDRPLIKVGFFATKTAALRAQAIRRRVGDRITLEADNNSGLGISGDFFIEAINHSWSHGTKLWETSWELAPV